MSSRHPAQKLSGVKRRVTSSPLGVTSQCLAIPSRTSQADWQRAPMGREYFASSEGLDPNKRLQDVMNMLNEADIYLQALRNSLREGRKVRRQGCRFAGAQESAAQFRTREPYVFQQFHYGRFQVNFTMQKRPRRACAGSGRSTTLMLSRSPTTRLKHTDRRRPHHAADRRTRALRNAELLSGQRGAVAVGPWR